MLPRGVMIAAALSLALVAAALAATGLRSDPGPEAVAAQPASQATAPETTRPSADPGRRPIRAVASRPRPEPAVPPELRAEKAETEKPEKLEHATPRAEPRPPPRPATGQEKMGQPQAARAGKVGPTDRPRKPRPAAQPAPEPEPAGRERKVRQLPSEKVKPAGKTGTKKKGGEPAPEKGVRGGKMALTIASLGLRERPVKSTASQRALDEGLIHLPQTSRPWDGGDTRNVYLVGHRLGWPGTGSWKVFKNLDKLRRGDELVLTGRGKTYRYRVSKKLVVSPKDVWVTEPVEGRDMLTLQTCTGPNFGKRLIVRADRV